MKKYLLAQLTQVSAWIGLLIMLGAFIAPGSWMFFFGLFLFLTDDEALKNWTTKHAPGLTKKFEEWTRNL